MKKSVLTLVFIVCTYTSHCLAFDAADVDISNEGFLGLAALISTSSTTPTFMFTQATGAEVWTSADPANPSAWAITTAQAVSDQTALPIRQMVFQNGTFYAGASGSNKIFRSTGGSDWAFSEAGLPATNITAMGAGGGRIIATEITANGLLSWSANGEDWFWASDGGASQIYADIVYSTDRFYALADSIDPPVIRGSPDGSGVWSLAATSTLNLTAATYIAFGNGEFHVHGTSNLGLAATNNLTTWTQADIGVAFTIQDLIFVDDGAGGRFIAVALGGGSFVQIRSVGDTTWRNPANSAPSVALHSICYSPTSKLLIAGGAAAADLWYSTDFGETWFQVGLSAFPAQNMTNCAVSG